MLRRADDTVIFSPTDGVLLLRGSRAPDGMVHARLDLVSVQSGQPWPLVLDGTLAETGFTGTYTTPTCRYRVALAPPKPPPPRYFAPNNIVQQATGLKLP